MLFDVINELEEFGYIRELGETYERENGSAPFALSHWDPLDRIAAELLMHLRLPPPPLATHYIYSHYLDVQSELLSRLGFNPHTQRSMIVPAGTNAMVMSIWWLRAIGINRIIVLCPVYFAVFYAAQVMSLECVRIYLGREEDHWYLPREPILNAIKEAPLNTAIWITNPVFCTGNYLSDSDVQFLESLLGSGVPVVADECLAINGYEIGKRLALIDRFVGIYSPHKAVSLNAVKFAAIVHDAKYQQFFDRWSDVLVGPLSASNHSAIFHFLGDNFAKFQYSFLQYMSTVQEEAKKTLREYGHAVQIDKDPIGHFMICYVPSVPGLEGNNKNFLKRLVSETGVLIIPGVRNHFSPSLGFNFRINLARSGLQFTAALHRIIGFLLEYTMPRSNGFES